MRLLLLLLLAMVSGCGQAHPLQDVALRLESEQSVCGATAVGPNVIDTAAHCLRFRLQTINGQPVQIVRSAMVGKDRVRVVVSGIRFRTWAPLGIAVVTERVRWWGHPMGAPFVYREGIVAWKDETTVAVDGTICHGDSGSGLFNDRGELVGVVSAMTSESGCTFMVAH